MYIEFSLPLGAAGQSAQLADYVISQELEAWSEKYGIPFAPNMSNTLNE
jgi:hypothetical protein